MGRDWVRGRDRVRGRDLVSKCTVKTIVHTGMDYNDWFIVDRDHNDYNSVFYV